MQSYVTLPFGLGGGEWTQVRFHVPEGCEVVSEAIVGETDGRSLSMLFQHIVVSSLSSG
jgi:hypothetical protein